MGIPTFFIALFAVLILFAATVAVYLQVYKRHINKALEATEGKRTIMVPPYKAAIVLTIIVLLIGILVSYFAGYYYAYKQYEEDIWVLSDSDIQAFYAEVKKLMNILYRLKVFPLMMRTIKVNLNLMIYGKD